MVQAENIQTILEKHQAKSFVLKQIEDWVYKKGVADFLRMTNLPALLREDLQQQVRIFSCEVSQQQTSADGSTTKVRMKLHDGYEVETVLLRHEKRTTVCISTQVGCAVGCTFCATGKMGFMRNLSVEEIFDQVAWARSWLMQEREFESDQSLPTNVVYMGMGEPFHNYQNTVESIKLLGKKLGISGRRITVSTVGIIPAIYKFAEEHLQVNLAFSLHNPFTVEREEIVPITSKYTLEALGEALDFYIQKTNRKIFIAYVMLENVNDSQDHARELVRWLQGKLAHVNLIAYNPIKEAQYTASSKERIRQFQDIVRYAGFPTTLRYTMGQDIMAACGQLIKKQERKKRIRTNHHE